MASLSVYLDLRAVEGALAGEISNAQPDGARLHQRVLGLVPAFIGADALRRARRHLVDDVGKSQSRVDLLQQRA